MVISLQPQAQEVDFPGKDPGEQFRFYFRKHWIHPARAFIQLLFWMLVFGTITYLSGVSSIEDPYTRRMVVALLTVFFLIPHLHFIMKMYKHYLCVSIVTDKKIHYFKRTLLAVDRHESVDLSSLQEFNKTQNGIVQNLFGFGSLHLEAQNTKMRIHFVPRINEVYDAIVQELGRKQSIPQTAKEKPADAVGETVEAVVNEQARVM